MYICTYPPNCILNLGLFYLQKNRLAVLSPRELNILHLKPKFYFTCQKDYQRVAKIFSPCKIINKSIYLYICIYPPLQPIKAPTYAYTRIYMYICAYPTNCILNLGLFYLQKNRLA